MKIEIIKFGEWKESVPIKVEVIRELGEFDGQPNEDALSEVMPDFKEWYWDENRDDEGVVVAHTEDGVYVLCPRDVRAGDNPYSYWEGPFKDLAEMYANVW